MAQYPEYYYRQSAVIPVRGRGEALRVLMISSRTGKRWVIPKGIIEPDLSPAASAAKEALEEAGISGQVLPEPIGSYQYKKWEGTCVAQVFVMLVDTVQDQWLESFRQRVWLTLEEALQRVNEEKLREIMRLVPSFLSPS
ncbi:MAG: NUDIX hydrolase [Magnetococcales bacterium]|nr:NUDIX hydrolase [Magnetococcales bacterium]